MLLSFRGFKFLLLPLRVKELESPELDDTPIEVCFLLY